MKTFPPYVLRITAAIFVMVTLSACTQEAKQERSLDSGMAYFKEGDFAAAEIEFKNTLESSSGEPEAIKHIGVIRVSQGANFEAVGILMHAKEQLPNDDEVGVCLAKAFLGMGFIPDSRKELIEVLDRTPGHAEALVQLAESSVTSEWMDECESRLEKAGEITDAVRLARALLQLRRGELESGAGLVEEVLSSDPNSARAHSLKAAIFSAKKQPDEALAEMKLAAGMAGARSGESVGYARMLVERGRMVEAVVYLKKITHDTPDFLPAWALLGQIAFRKNDDVLATSHFTRVLAKNPADMITAMAQAEIFVRGKQAEKAVELLEKVATVLPGRPPLELALAKAAIEAGKVVKAAGVLDGVLEVAPDFPEVAQIRAAIFLQDGNSLDAIKLLERVVDKSFKDVPSRDLLVRALRVAGRDDDAVALLRKIVESDDDHLASRIELGRILVSQGKLVDARLVFEVAVERFPDDLTAISNLSSIDLKEGHGDMALERIDDFIARCADVSDAYMVKAVIALRMEQSELADNMLEKAIELDPGNFHAYGMLLQIRNGVGEEGEALVLIDRFLAVFPSDMHALLQRGYLLQMLGRDDDARAVFAGLIDAHPDFAAAYNNLAALEADAFGDLQAAAVHASKARSLDALQPAIADTLGWIEWQLGNYPVALSLLIEAAEKLGDHAEVQYHLGMAHYAMGQAAEAGVALEKALASDVEFPKMADARGYLTFLREIGGLSLEDLQSRCVEKPKDVMAHLQVARLLASSGRAEEALAFYQKVNELNPVIPAVFVGQARLYGGSLGSPEKALKAATAARELAPRDPEVLAVLGFAKLLVGEFEEAYGLLKDAAVVMHDDLSVTYHFARAAYSLGRVPEARAAMIRAAAVGSEVAEDANKFLRFTDDSAMAIQGIDAEVALALAKDPADVCALMLRGALDDAAGKPSEATYLAVLKIHPRFDPARVRLAAHLMDDSARLDEALEFARDARVSMTEDLELMRIFALINYRKGDFKYASQLLAELAIRRPLMADELLIHGMALVHSDQSAMARPILEEALQAGLPESDAEMVKATLIRLD